MQKIHSNRKIIVLTGGPCGGKTTLLKRLLGQECYQKRVAVLPEAIFVAFRTNIQPGDKLFQRVMVEIQASLESALDRSLEKGMPIIAHRGTLDPLAYWQKYGWDEREFFHYTQTDLTQHYKRYEAVIHLQSTAVNVPEYYINHPDAHRYESSEEAARLDELLQKAWCEHQNYFFIENGEGRWEEKEQKAFSVLEKFIFE